MHVDGGHRQKPIDFQRCQFQNGRLAAILNFLVSRLQLGYQLQTSGAQYSCIWVGTYWFSACRFQNGRLVAILNFLVSGLCRWHGFRSVSRVCFGISMPNFICMLMVIIGRSLLIFSKTATSLSKWPPGGHIGFFGFQTLTLVWLWISTPNLSGTILVCMCRSLLIFSNVNFKMAARQPYWIFWFRTLTLVWLRISTPNFSGTILIYIWVGAY